MNTIELKSGNIIPQIGFGTWQVTPDTIARAVVTLALQAGYRLIDTASIYRNEVGVGEAIRKSGIPRSEIFVTTKLWSSDQGYENAIKALESSLNKLGLEYVDLFLIHWPTNPKKRRESWLALEELAKQGKTKTIGVSNYSVEHLKELLSYATITPDVNQIEYHPFISKSQQPIVDFCKVNSIAVEAYSPLTSSSKLRDFRINQIAQKLNVTNAQILLRWAIQHGTIPLPRSTEERHIEQNIDVFNFEIAQEDMEHIDNLYNGHRLSPDPQLIA